MTLRLATVIENPNIHQKFVLIGHRLVGYGSINLLCYGTSEESIMRLFSRELAVSWRQRFKQ